MGFYAEPLLREARERVQTLPNQIATNPKPPDFDQLAEAVEKAIKAALVESHGSLPQHHDHRHLVAICQTTGVWDVLPPALQGLIQEVEAYQSTRSSAVSLASASTPTEQLQKYLFAARRLIDYMEFHIIGNDSVLKRLKVA
jgi:HEPN domain-containing protein